MGNRYDGGDRWMTGQCGPGCESFIPKGSEGFLDRVRSLSRKRQVLDPKIEGICQLEAWKFLFRKPDDFSRLKAAKKCQFFRGEQMGERLSKALDRLADMFEYGHLEASTDPAAFIERVIERLSETKRPAGETIGASGETGGIPGETEREKTIRLILSKIERRGEIPDTCDCEGCRKNIEEYGDHLCQHCGYKGKYVAIACACYDQMCNGGKAAGVGCFHGALTCPVCQEGDSDVDPWKIVGAVQMAMRGEKPEDIGKFMRGEDAPQGLQGAS